MVMLAIVLIELYMGKPIHKLAQYLSFGVGPLQTIDENSRYRLATRAFQRCGSDFTDNYRLAIATWLDLDLRLDADDNDLEGDEFKELVYRAIVQCLVDELDQGFGESMPINNLDEAGPTLNPNMGETMNLTSLEDANISLSTEPRDPESVLTTWSRQTTYIEWDERSSQCAIVTGEGTTECDINTPITPNSLTHEGYIVGWICALAEEMAAARAMLDDYVLGRIGTHNIVLACLPSGVTGTTSAVVVANRMRSTFYGLRFGLMVGIGGAAPSKTGDVRLGDVVVGIPHGGYSGVVQYDFGKTIKEANVCNLGTEPSSKDSAHCGQQPRVTEFPPRASNSSLSPPNGRTVSSTDGGSWLGRRLSMSRHTGH
ncbi:hypothetical protein BJX99DRAFT_260430 [Aspergillus californicus]